MPSEVRFGPDPYWNEQAALKQGDELGRIMLEAVDRMRRGLWFWEV